MKYNNGYHDWRLGLYNLGLLKKSKQMEKALLIDVKTHLENDVKCPNFEEFKKLTSLFEKDEVKNK